MGLSTARELAKAAGLPELVDGHGTGDDEERTNVYEDDEHLSVLITKEEELAGHKEKESRTERREKRGRRFLRMMR